jgi:hypothetical protein
MKVPRKGRVSPVSDKVHEYSRHVERLQKFAAKLPPIPDETAIQLEQSIAEELDFLRHIHGGMGSSNDMIP